jgi:hypothetical protein
MRPLQRHCCQQRFGPCRAHLVVAQVDLSGVRAWKANT